MSQIPYELTGKNPYDMRIPCGDSQLCYDFDRFTKWLNSKSVQQELGVSKIWQSCNRAVDLLFVSAGDWMLNYHTLIPDLLHDGIEVLSMQVMRTTSAIGWATRRGRKSSIG